MVARRALVDRRRARPGRGARRRVAVLALAGLAAAALVVSLAAAPGGNGLVWTLFGSAAAVLVVAVAAVLSRALGRRDRGATLTRVPGAFV